MSAVLMTLFAVSILGTLGLAVYGLRVLVSRWEQPRRHEALRPVPKLPPLGPLQAQPQAARPLQAAPVWVSAAGSAPAPAPLVVPVGIATPPPMMVPPAAPLVFMPPQPVAPPAPVFMPPLPPQAARPQPAAPPRAPSPGYQVAGTHSPRMARGSTPPDFAAAAARAESSSGLELEPDTDPGVLLEDITSTSQVPVVQRGARFSVVRSTRR